MTEVARVHFVNPRDISLICGSKRLMQYLGEEQTRELYRGSTGALELGGDWDQPLDTQFEASDVYQSFRSVVLRDKPWALTPYYANALRRIERGTSRFKSPGAFAKRCSDLLGLYRAIQSKGYKTQEELAAAGQETENEITVALDRNGRMMFLDGQHRLSIVKILGLPAVPVRIVLRHPRWTAFRREVESWAAGQPDGLLPETLPHPDLESIPARQGSERFAMMAAQMKMADFRNRRLLHVGAGWGVQCLHFSKAGLHCTALESSPEPLRCMNVLRLACNRPFQVYGGTLLGFPHLKPFDLVLLLDVLSAYVREKALYKRMLQALHGLRPRLIFFSAREPDPALPAYRRPDPAEFAALVAEHTGMRGVERIGTTEDGEVFFKIWGPRRLETAASAAADAGPLEDGAVNLA